MNLLKLLFRRRGLLSNLESIVGASVALVGLSLASHLGVEFSADTAFAVIGGGVLIGNQLLGGLDVFKRFDTEHKATFELLSGKGPGTSDSMAESVEEQRKP